ncbi:hypothetical protein CCUS01_13581 [Colletotrichum cuscutae]|uniref:Uncharacterized protein n=1 Tax=Colletotrichum cuscutae TaxID=1209917 RepID=A0AAI9YBD4_9PEZI|nr:hypothetical protein CCUS01_13581 [Colletotrichum cuscutae]
MVQYILTPWRDRRELLKVRQQFYPAAPASASAAPTTSTSAARASGTAATAASAAAASQALTRSWIRGTATQAQAQAHAPAPASAPTPSSSSSAPATSTSTNKTTPSSDKHHAVARVSMWMQRGNCPHMVESTALLTAAILSDAESKGGAGTYAVRAAYAAAFSRYVLHLSPEFPLVSLSSVSNLITCLFSVVLHHLKGQERLFVSSKFKVRRASERKESLVGVFYVPSYARLLLLLLSALGVLSLESGLKQSQSSRDLGRLFSFVTSTFGFRRISHLTSLFDFSVIFTHPSTQTYTRPPSHHRSTLCTVAPSLSLPPTRVGSRLKDHQQSPDLRDCWKPHTPSQAFTYTHTAPTSTPTPPLFPPSRFPASRRGFAIGRLTLFGKRQRCSTLGSYGLRDVPGIGGSLA